MKVVDSTLKLSMVSIASVAAFFSIYGLANIFSSAFISVIIMGIVLEIGKLVAVSVLYQYWKYFHFLLKSYLIAAIIILMAITSVGIFGYLSAAYQADSMDLVKIEQTIQLKQEDLNYKKQQLDRIQKDIDRTPASYVTKRMELQERYKPELQQLEADIEKINKEIYDNKNKLIHTQAHIGPIIYIAKTFDKSPDDAILYIVILIMLVFDPLAIGLTICANKISMKNRELLSKENDSPQKKEVDKPISPEEIHRSRIENMSFDSMIMYKNKLLSHNRTLTDSEKTDLKLINKILEEKY